MSEQVRKRKLLYKRLFNKRRLIILNEETFEEIFSLKINLMNVFVVLTISSIVLIGITTYVIAFTPLREYIPGYSSTALQKKAIVLEEQTREMEKELQQNALFLESIRKVLIGDLEYAKFNKDSILASQKEELAKLNLLPNHADSLLRMQVAQEDKYNLFEKSKPRVSLVLFSPVTGKVLETFDPKNRFFGIRVQTVLNKPIKAVANGTVIFSDWTPVQGNMLMIRHPDGIISVYKGISDRSKVQGEIVRTGEVIGFGSESLVFELWKEGFPIDPLQFLDFN